MYKISKIENISENCSVVVVIKGEEKGYLKHGYYYYSKFLNTPCNLKAVDPSLYHSIREFLYFEQSLIGKVLWRER